MTVGRLRISSLSFNVGFSFPNKERYKTKVLKPEYCLWLVMKYKYSSFVSWLKGLLIVIDNQQHHLTIIFAVVSAQINPI